jgi:hypothetical protein
VEFERHRHGSHHPHWPFECRTQRHLLRRKFPIAKNDTASRLGGLREERNFSCRERSSVARRNSSGGYHAVEMGTRSKLLDPAVQKGQEARSGSDPLGINCHFQKSVGRGTEQNRWFCTASGLGARVQRVGGAAWRGMRMNEQPNESPMQSMARRNREEALLRAPDAIIETPPISTRPCAFNELAENS